MLTKRAGTWKRRGGSKALALVAGAVLMLGMLAGCSDANSDRNSFGSSANNGNGGSAATESTPLANATDDAKASANVTTTNSAADSAATDASQAAPNQASGALAPDTAGSGTALAPAAEDGDLGFERKIVYRGNVAMEVKSYDEAQTGLRDLIRLSGGYLLNFADQKTATERGGTFTVKIPASGFNGFLTGLEKIEHVSYQSSAKGTDVTQEYVDLQARLKARQVVEARLLDFMAKATKTADLLQISNQLGDVQTEIEQIKGRIRYLDNNVAYSTVDLRLYESTKPAEVADQGKQGFGERMSKAAKGSTSFMYGFLQDLIILLAGALPVLAVIAVIGFPVYVLVRSNQRKRASSMKPASPKPLAPEAGETDGTDNTDRTNEADHEEPSNRNEDSQ